MAVPEVDVVIVGGRPAGASLAARVAASGLSVLVVDKAEFPSAPQVPCCPIMYSAAVELLDEIGFDEAKYAHAATRVHKGIIGFEGHFQVVIPIPETRGRNYLYGFDRAGFDHALWQHLGSFPTIERRSGFHMHELVRDASGKVIGIEGNAPGEPREQIRARVAVVGADGRFSHVARKAGARVVEQQLAHTSTVHFAEWEGVAPALPDGEPALHINSTGRGANVLFFPSKQGHYAIATQIRTDRVHIDGHAQAWYRRQLDAVGTVHERIKHARQVNQVVGVRRIANAYRDAGGPGWVLVGDALHHKDPIDGQGIRDALAEARALAPLLVQMRDEALVWPELLARYRRAVHAETHDMYEATMGRLERDLYRDAPKLVIDTLIRWSLTDPEYQQRFLRFLARELPPEQFRTPGLMAAVIARGMARDLRSWWTG